MSGHDVKKWLQSFFRDRVFTVLFILVLLLCLGAVISVVSPSSGTSYTAVNTTSSNTAGELYDGESLTLDFVSPKNGLKGLSFTVSTYGKEISAGTLSVRFATKEGSVIYSTEVAGSSLRDQSILKIDFLQLT